MQYTAKREFNADPERTFDLIEGVFTARNYSVISRDGRTITLEDSGDAGKTVRSLFGVSSVSFTINEGTLAMSARMSGIGKLSKALVILPFVLGIVLLAVFSFLFRDMGPKFIAMVSLGPVLPWVVVSPLIINWLRKRAQGALESLIDSIASKG